MSEYYWGSPTALINWCEQDYVLDSHIAEFWNATTNIFYLWAGLNGVRLWRRYDLPITFLIGSVGIILTSTFSFLFHSTLLYSLQKLDEIFENISMVAILHSFESYDSLLGVHIVSVFLGTVFYKQWFAEIHLIVVVILASYHLFSLARSTDLRIPVNIVTEYSRKVIGFTLIGAISWLLDRILCRIDGINFTIPMTDIALNYDFVVDLNALPYGIPNIQLHAFGWHMFTALALNEMFVILCVLHAYYAKSKMESKGDDKKSLEYDGFAGGNMNNYSDKFLGLLKGENLGIKFDKIVGGLVTVDVKFARKKTKQN